MCKVQLAHRSHSLTLSLPFHPCPAVQRKRLEPFEVPQSGDFWLHDDRFDPGEGEGEGGGGMRSAEPDAELDERQK